MTDRREQRSDGEHARGPGPGRGLAVGLAPRVHCLALDDAAVHRRRTLHTGVPSERSASFVFLFCFVIYPILSNLRLEAFQTLRKLSVLLL